MNQVKNKEFVVKSLLPSLSLSLTGRRVTKGGMTPLWYLFPAFGQAKRGWGNFRKKVFRQFWTLQ
jgi:hypothetical protein